MKRKAVLILALILIIGVQLKAQATSDSLEFEWEASVNYGNSGQTTVFLNDTLWHFGSKFFYGTPFGIKFWEYSYVEYMALNDNFWVVDTVKTLYRTNGNTEVSGDLIYIFGGTGATGSALEIFNPVNRTITMGADVPTPRRYGGSAAYQGKIYLIGGADAVGFSDKLEIYDIGTNTWSSGAPLPVATQTDAVVKDGKIYTMGGYNGSVLDAIYEYDIASNSWSQIGTMPSATSAHTMAISGDHIYVLGDFADLNRVMRYTISDGSWVDYETNMVGRRHASATIAKDKLYYVAGNASRSNGTYQRFRIVQSIDLTAPTTTSLTPDQVVPTALYLEQNFPNPFNPSTSIRFSLFESTQVEVSIFNVRGQVVRVLKEGLLEQGDHDLVWDGKNSDGQLLPSGQYVYSLRTKAGSTAKKMIMLR